MRLSIAYESMNINSINELKKVNKPDYSIEIICGNFGKGKTYLLNEYFYSYECCKAIYYKQIVSDEEKNLPNSFNLNDIKIDDLENYIDTYGKIIIYQDDFDKNNIETTIPVLIYYCANKNIELLLDIVHLIDLFSHIKNINKKVNIVTTLINSNSVLNHAKSELKDCFLPVIYTEIDYLKINELKEIDKYSGNISLRVPKSLHYNLIKEAKNEDVSLNQYLLYILASRNN